MRSTLLALLCAFAFACRVGPGPGDGGSDGGAGDGGEDTAADGGNDTGTDADAGSDAAADTGTDAGTDAGDAGADVTPPPAPQGTKLFEGDIDSVSVSPSGELVAVIQADTLKIRQVAAAPTAAISVSTGVNNTRRPIWSGDNAYILYDKGTTSTRDAFIAESGGANPHELLPAAPDTGVALFSSFVPQSDSKVVFTTAAATQGLRNIYFGPPVGPWTKVAENVATPFVYSANLSKLLAAVNCVAGAAQGMYNCDLRTVNLDSGETHDIITDKSAHKGGSHNIMLTSNGAYAAYFGLLTEPDREELRVVPVTGGAGDVEVVATGAAANPTAVPPVPQELVGYVNRYGNTDRLMWFQGPEWDDLYGVDASASGSSVVLLADYAATAVWSDCRSLGDDGAGEATHLSFTTAADGEDYGEEWLLEWAHPTTVRKPIANSALACSLTQSPDKSWYGVVDGPSASNYFGTLKIGRLSALADTTPTSTLGTAVYETDYKFAPDSLHVAFAHDTNSEFVGQLEVAPLPQTGTPAGAGVINATTYLFDWFSPTRLVYIAEPDSAQPPYYKLYRYTVGTSTGAGDLIYERSQTFWQAVGGGILLQIDLGPDKGLWLAAEPE